MANLPCSRAFVSLAVNQNRNNSRAAHLPAHSPEFGRRSAKRRYVAGAPLWTWANAAARAVGMPAVFIGVGASSVGASALSVALTVVVTIAAAGASVGAIHGVALLWLLRQRQKGTI